jgi:alpha-L-arabinofuranosidase
MTITRICLTAFFSFPVLLNAQVPAPMPPASGSTPATISIDASSSPGPVNRLIFGHNSEACDNARIFSSDTTDANLLETGCGLWDPAKQAPVPAILDRAQGVGMSLLRYPGGSMVCNYDWRKAVGPLSARGDWKFGVDEYLALCKAIGAEPMFTMSDYVLPADQLPAHLASLVEYLNAPATPDHPWAMKRKDWGHPDPYGVKWFELGNESASGNMRVLPQRKYTAEQYAAYANASAAAMRAVDPSIKIGIVMMPSPGTDVECSWNRTVARLAGKSADYLIVHLYGPDVGKNAADPDFQQACLAVGEQSAAHLDEYQAMALRESGRALPIAITEYNGTLAEEKASYRLSYLLAFECADLLRIYLQPEHHVLTASYWEFLNGAFGLVRSDRMAPDGGTITEEPAYTLYKLWADHLGTKLATTHVDSPRITFAGTGSVFPATGDAYLPARSLGAVPTDGQIDFSKLPPSITGEGGTGGAFALILNGARGKAYPDFAVLPKPEGAAQCDYDITYDARFVSGEGSQPKSVGIGIGDSRGWPATRSEIGIEGIGPDWKTFHERYHGLPDTTAILLQARLDFGGGSVSGRLELRNLKIEAFAAPQYPAYQSLTACSTLSEDGKTLHLIVFNKTTAQDISARLQVTGFHPASARIWEVNSPNLAAVQGVTQTVQGTPLDLTGPETDHLFPAHSMTAIDFVAQAATQNP